MNILVIGCDQVGASLVRDLEHIGHDISLIEKDPEQLKRLDAFDDYRFRGTPSHAGMQPEVGRNALMAAAGAAMSLMALPRHGEGMTRVNVGYLRAGEGRNVIASTAEMFFFFVWDTS